VTARRHSILKEPPTETIKLDAIDQLENAEETAI
jgi:hypothetical protein